MAQTEKQSQFLHVMNHLVAIFNVHTLNDSNSNQNGRKRRCQNKSFANTKNANNNEIFGILCNNFRVSFYFVLNFSGFDWLWCRWFMFNSMWLKRKLKKKLWRAEILYASANTIHTIFADDSLIKWITSHANTSVANLISGSCQVVWRRQADFGLERGEFQLTKLSWKGAQIKR